MSGQADSSNFSHFVSLQNFSRVPKLFTSLCRVPCVVIQMMRISNFASNVAMQGDPLWRSLLRRSLILTNDTLHSNYSSYRNSGPLLDTLNRKPRWNVNLCNSLQVCPTSPSPWKKGKSRPILARFLRFKDCQSMLALGLRLRLRNQL